MAMWCVAMLLLRVATGSASGMELLRARTLTPTNFSPLGTSNNSVLYSVELPPGAQHQIGYDYAALLHTQTAETLQSFLDKVFPKSQDQQLLMLFVDWCWVKFLKPHTPAWFLEELDGMRSFHAAAGPQPHNSTSDVVSQRFLALANMPADSVNIVAMLEQECEPQWWPQWLKDGVDDIISILEHLVHSCDAYGVWGSRTEGGLLYSSRNLDYNSNTGINRHKIVIFFDIDDPKYGGKPQGGVYASVGFAFGLGALAGMSQAGITTSEMNLDNDVVTFAGMPFPLRLRAILEQSTDLHSAMVVWNSTHNTNSFNFLIGSAADVARGQGGALALETIMGYTAVFPADSPVERAATYLCPNATSCAKWTNKIGVVRIGAPLAEAVWRSNHGFNPRVMATQEPLFNNTVFRYNLMHDVFAQLQAAQARVDAETAVRIVATLATKGPNYLTCNQTLSGDNVMSIAYAPGPRGMAAAPGERSGFLYAAWESGSGAQWRPAACAPYVLIDFERWM